MGNLKSYFEVIEQMGQERKAQRDQVREVINQMGEPHAEMTLDADEKTELRFWRIKGGVTEIFFRDGKADIDSIRTHSDEYIDKLVHSKAHIPIERKKG
jgi:hypothetical protein